MLCKNLPFLQNVQKPTKHYASPTASCLKKTDELVSNKFNSDEKSASVTKVRLRHTGITPVTVSHFLRKLQSVHFMWV